GRHPPVVLARLQVRELHRRLLQPLAVHERTVEVGAVVEHHVVGGGGGHRLPGEEGGGARGVRVAELGVVGRGDQAGQWGGWGGGTGVGRGGSTSLGPALPAASTFTASLVPRVATSPDRERTSLWPRKMRMSLSPDSAARRLPSVSPWAVVLTVGFSALG